MVVQIKQLMLTVVAAIIYTKAATQPVSLPNCSRTCGSVDIPFPFGTTKDCSLDKTFLINCNKTSSNTTDVPFLPLSNQRVIDISIDGVMRVAWPVASDCYTEKGTLVNQSLQVQDINMTYFPVSPTQNMLTVVGCDTFGVFEAVDSGGNNYTTGCLALCNRPTDILANDSCSGTGCCEISIPQGHVFIEAAYYSFSIENHSLVHDFNPCGYAFLVQYGNYSFKLRDLLRLEKEEFPVVLSWAVGKKTCQEAKKDDSSYACIAENSECYNPTDHRYGYLCNCSHGYRGNPYLIHGCQEINECMESNDCVKGATCDNLPGSYRCKCATGYKGDGKNNGTRCSPISSTKSGKEIILIVSLSVSVSLVAMLVGSFYAYLALKKRKLIKLKEHFFQQNGGVLLQQQIERHRGSSETAKVFTVEELNKATNNFHEGKILGQGGQGTVYKGVLQDERVVAIKKSKINDLNQIEPFINEVVILSKINHRNVVKLLGCCLETEVPLLVYEFIPNGTLYEHLHDQNHSIKLTWKTRLRIAKETAGVLAYLHSATSTPVIHRDVKSTNILLDGNLTAKVSDFGASRIVPLDHTQITTLVQGTLGYLDPEYFHTSQLTDKSDVYSFGEVCLRVKGEERPTMKEVAMELEGIFVIEEHHWARGNMSSEENESLLKATPSIIDVEDSIGRNGISTSNSHSINEISMSLIGGR